MKVSAYCNIWSLHTLILFSIRGQRRGRVILLGITRTFATFRVTSIHNRLSLVRIGIHLMGSQLDDLSRDFFWAHAVRARGSDGHQNVLFEIGNSHMLEKRWEEKLGVFNTKQANKQTTTQPTTNQNNPKRHLGNYVKHYAFRKSPSRSVLLRDVIASPIQISQVTQFLEVHVGGGPVSSQSWTRVRSWFTHVHVDETAQGRSTIAIVIATMHMPETKERSLFLLL